MDTFCQRGLKVAEAKTFAYVALSRTVTICQDETCDIHLARIDAIRRTKLVPDIIVKVIEHIPMTSRSEYDLPKVLTFRSVSQYNKPKQRGLLDGTSIEVAVVRAVRPTGWYAHQSGGGRSGESYREEHKLC